MWYLDANGSGSWEQASDSAIAFGMAGDIPVVGDWTGTGATRIGVFRGGVLYLDANGNGAWDPGTDLVVAFGAAGDKPVAMK
jgi:hypothetical protein